MTARLQISPEEYLATSFDGLDREYVHGELIERAMPTFDHGEIQGILFSRFHRFSQSHHLYPCVELRLRLDADTFRIPDVCVFEGRPLEQVPSTAPLLAIEVVSPDDRYIALAQKLEEFRLWGVPHIWLVDPILRRLSIYRSSGLSIVSVLNLPGYPIELTADDLFAAH